MSVAGYWASENGINERCFWVNGVVRMKSAWFGDSVIYIFENCLLGCLSFIIELISKAIKMMVKTN